MQKSVEGPLEYSVECHSAYVSEKTSQGQGKNHPEGSKGIILGVHIKPDVVPVPNSSLNAKKGLASLVRKTISRLIATLVPHNKS